MTTLTASEQQFEQLCRRCGLRLARIPVGARQTPDYVLRRCFSSAIVEIKQFDDNSDDRRYRPARDAALSNGKTVVVDHAIGSGIGRAISDSNSQFKAMGSKRANLLVIYNNKSFDNQTTETDLNSMFGIQQLRLDRDIRGRIWHVGTKHAGRRKLTPNQNTTISAIAVMKQEGVLPQHPLVADLRVYHNPFAARPLARRLFAYISAIEQFVATNDPNSGHITWRRL